MARKRPSPGPGATLTVDDKANLVQHWTRDTFENFATRIGVNAGSIFGAGNYGFNPISRNRLRLEWAYRGSWIVGTIVDAPAEDMTREGVQLHSDDTPEDLEAIELLMTRLQFWPKMLQVCKWARLYGGAIGWIMIDGQKTDTPLDEDTVGPSAKFLGIYPFDRWQAYPDLSSLVREPGPMLGQPEFYDVRPDPGTGMPTLRIHHTRVIRVDGTEIPWWQKVTENYWGISIIERLWDRLIAFDSATVGAAQLVYKAHLRTYKVKKLREIIATGGKLYDGLVKQIDLIRQFQSIEGLTLMDGEDEFQVDAYQFSGLGDLITQFGQQLSGAAQIPLVRLFGQAPAGLNSTGESDWRNYYDGIKRMQQVMLYNGTNLSYRLAYRTKFGKPPGEEFVAEFSPLWQMDDEERANVTKTMVEAIMTPFNAGLTGRAVSLSELRQLRGITGAFSNITDTEIAQAKKDDEVTPPGATQLLGAGIDPKTGEPVPDPADEGRSPGEPEKAKAKNGAGGGDVRPSA